MKDQAEIHVEEKKTAEFKKQAPTEKKSLDVRNSSLKQTQSRRTCQRCNGSVADSGTVSSSRRQVGKTDGNDMRKPEATEASQATTKPEEHGDDAQRQEVGR